MNIEQFTEFAESIIPDILMNNGVGTILIAMHRGKAGHIVELEKFNEKREFYQMQIPQMLESLEADGYILVSAGRMTQHNVRQEVVIFHYQPQDGKGFSRCYTMIRDPKGRVFRLVFDDKRDGEPMTGQLAELFHEPKAH